MEPDRAKEFSSICKMAQAKTMEEEPGCLRLDILQVTDPEKEDDVIENKFIVYEIFKDKNAYEHHTQQPYTQPIGEFIQSGAIFHEDAYVAKELYMTTGK